MTTSPTSPEPHDSYPSHTPAQDPVWYGNYPMTQDKVESPLAGSILLVVGGALLTLIGMTGVMLFNIAGVVIFAIGVMVLVPAILSLKRRIRAQQRHHVFH